jgi:RNA polymerase sigma factor for flagellar operon FliA
VRRAIEVLPAGERRIVELHYYGGDSLSETTVKFGVSRPWAYRLHARALETLKLALADLAGELEL